MALLLARGKSSSRLTEHRPPDHGGRPRALVRLHGRPLFDYPLLALQGSSVDRVFVLQDEGAGLEQAVDFHPKNCFLSGPQLSEAPSASFSYALGQISLAFGGVTAERPNVLVVPCDLPLSAPEHFDALIAVGCRPDKHGTIFLVENATLTRRFPQRQRSFWHSRSGVASGTLLGTLLINGSKVGLSGGTAGPSAGLSFHGLSPAASRRISRSLDESFRTRTRWYGKLYLSFLILRLAKANGSLLSSINSGWQELIGRLSVDRLPAVAEAISGLKLQIAVLNQPELAWDADTNRDLVLIGEVMTRAGRDHGRFR